jgi:DNA-binding PadR family transcriptional regulator
MPNADRSFSRHEDASRPTPQRGFQPPGDQADGIPIEDLKRTGYYIRNGYMDDSLTPAVFHVLLALTDGEKHGYAIMQEVAASTRGKFIMGPGTLYGTVKRLLDAGLIEESGEIPDRKLGDERRRYYRITNSGRTSARAEAERLELLVRTTAVKSLLKRPRST